MGGLLCKCENLILYDLLYLANELNFHHHIDFFLSPVDIYKPFDRTILHTFPIRVSDFFLFSLDSNTNDT